MGLLLFTSQTLIKWETFYGGIRFGLNVVVGFFNVRQSYASAMNCFYNRLIVADMHQSCVMFSCLTTCSFVVGKTLKLSFGSMKSFHFLEAKTFFKLEIKT